MSLIVYRFRYKKAVLLALTVILVSVGYLFTSAKTGGIGFPLDDAWIHQVFARNFAQFGEWAFEHNNPSAGSTSPLWSLLLSIGYWAGFSPYVIPFLLGGFSLLLLGIMVENIFNKMVPFQNSWVPIAGLFLVGEWHLVWAAVSGMEILYFSVLVLSVFILLFYLEKDHAVHHLSFCLMAGVATGISVWVRPEGMTLLGPAAFVIVFMQPQSNKKPIWLGLYLLGFICLFIPFVLFNLHISGNWMPNTFYAKQAEYAFILEYPLIQRLFLQIRQPMVGSGIMLLPGVIYCFWWAWKKKWMVGLAAYLWWMGFTTLYALRLPVTYQHGRYQIPGMVIYFILGLIGVGLIVESLKKWNPEIIKRVILRTWLIATGLVWVAFLVLGGNAYSHDVGFINTEMVAASRWVAKNTKPDALIAAHDIGAMGYFGQRQIIDLAGLVSPEVIPIILNEELLKKYLDEQKVDYLFTFPDWYPLLVKYGEPVFVTNGIFANQLGSENMVVYRWR